MTTQRPLHVPQGGRRIRRLSQIARTGALATLAALALLPGCKKDDGGGGEGGTNGPAKAPLSVRFGNLDKLGDIPVPTGAPARGLALNPDGSGFAFGGSDGSINLVEFGKAGKPRVLSAHRESVLELAFTPDGQRLVSAAADNRLLVWDLKTGKPIHDIKAHNGDIKALAVSSDGTLAATGSVDDDVRVWRLQDGKRLHHFQGHSSTVYTVAFSPNGQHVYSGARDAQVQRWSLEKGAADGEPLVLKNTIIALRFSPDNNVLYALGLTGELVHIDPGAFEVKHTRRIGSSRLTDLAVGPDGTLAVSETNGKLSLWSADPASTEPLVAPFEAHKGEILQLRAKGKDFFTLGKDKRYATWTLEGKPAAAAADLPPINGRVDALALADEAGRFALVSADKLLVGSTDAPETAKPGPDLGSGGISSLAYTKDGKKLLVGRKNGNILELDPAKEYAAGEAHPVHGGAVRHLLVGDDGAIYTAGDDIAIFKLDPKTFEPKVSITDHTSHIRAFAVDPQGKRMASSESDNITIIRYIESNTVQWTRRGHRVTHLAFSPDGKILAMVESNREIVLYDVEDRREVKKLKGSPSRIRAMGIHQGGEVLLTVDNQGNLRAWSAEDGSMLATGDAGRGRPTSLAVGSAKNLVLTGGMDPAGSAKLFRLGPSK